MIHTIQVALTGLITPERLDVLVESARLLETSGQSTPLDEVQEVIEIQNSNTDNAILVSRITDVLEIGINQTLRHFGIICTDEAPLAAKNAILHTVSSIEDYLIPEHTVGLLSGYFNNEEVIAHMVPIFTSLSTDEAIEYIQEVTDELIVRMTEVIESEMLKRGPIEVTLPPDNTARLATLNRLIKAVGDKRVTMVRQLLDSGVRAGRPLIGLLETQLTELDTLEPEQLASELLSLSVFSDTPLSDVPQKTKEMISDFTESLQIQRIIELELNKLTALCGLTT